MVVGGGSKSERKRERVLSLDLCYVSGTGPLFHNQTNYIAGCSGLVTRLERGSEGEREGQRERGREGDKKRRRERKGGGRERETGCQLGMEGGRERSFIDNQEVTGGQ